jgi:ketosteroid isomerase-like protein
MARVVPSERFRAELDEALAGVGQEQDPVETIGRLGARLILQQALEDEVLEFLGRARYERAEEAVSHRNGYEPRKVRTTSGAGPGCATRRGWAGRARGKLAAVVIGDVEIVRGWYAETGGRVDEAALAYWYANAWHPDIDWRAVVGAPDDSGVMHGRDRVRAYFEELLEAFENIVVELLELLEIGDHVVADVRLAGRSRSAGVPTEIRFALTYLLRDGKLLSGREYLTREEAIAAASLAGQ